MGITDLNKFTTKNSPNSKQIIKAEDFSGLRIAIDAYGLAYRFMWRSNKGNISSFNIRLDPSSTTDNYKRDADWYRYFIEIGNTFSSLGIVPVFVFDGTSIPEKKKTQQARKEVKKKSFNNMKVLEKELSDKSISERSDEDVEELRKMKVGILFVDREIIERLKDLLLEMGFPVVSSKGEGEKTCVMLSLEGEVAGVFSNDTDCTAMGCPILIDSIKGSGSRLSFDVILYDEILNSINFLPEEFLDLCILGGSDFSENLPGYRITKIFPIMNKLRPNSRNIENVVKSLEEKMKITEENIENLDYEKCRSKLIFGREKAVETIDKKYEGVMPSLDIDLGAIKSDHIREKMESLGVSDMYNLTKASFRNMSSKHNYKGGAEKVLKGGIIVARTGKLNFVITDDKPTPKIPKPKVEEIKITHTEPSLEILKEKTKIVAGDLHVGNSEKRPIKRKIFV
jgi:5'-3' exonuclease